jgi:hypothetical protein
LYTSIQPHLAPGQGKSFEIHFKLIQGTSSITDAKLTLSVLSKINFSYISSTIINKLYFLHSEINFFIICCGNTAPVGLSGFITKIHTIFGLYLILFSNSSKSGYQLLLGSNLYVR